MSVNQEEPRQLKEPQGLVDASGTPVGEPPSGLRKLLRWAGVAEWTLFVLGIQALALVLQLRTLQRQTTLMERDASIAETQQKLATRLFILVRHLKPMEGIPSELPGWVIENKGRYLVRNLTLKLFHFKKFVGLGWHSSVGGESALMPELKSGESHLLDLKAPTEFAKQYDIVGYTPVRFADFVVVAITFQRDVDDKRYLYLVPFEVWDNVPRMIRPELTSVAGPLGKSCTMDAYAVELMFELLRRNPIPYPVELYNYHYLFGEPSSTCLQSGSPSLRF
jgi:hypothetical protein